MRPATIARVLIVALAIGLAVLGSAVGLSALGRPFASLFVDPFGDYSVVHLSSWEPVDRGLQAGDRLIAIDGVAADAPAEALDAALAHARDRGAQALALTFRRGDTIHHVEAPLRTLTPTEWWWLFGFYALLGFAFLWSGLAVWRIAPGRPATAAYVATTVNSFAFLISFYDYHTTRLLSPVFAAASLGNALGVLALALTFPSVPGWWPRARGPLTVLLAAGFAGMGALAICAAAGVDARPLRLGVNVAVPGSLLVLAVVSGIRHFAMPREAQRALRGVALSLCAVPLALAAAAVSDQLLDTETLPITLPLVGLLVPAGIGLSLVRTDFFITGAVLTRQLLMVPVAFAAAALAGSAWVWAHDGGAPHSVALIFGAITFVLTCLVGWLAFTRWFFRGRALYRPAVRELAELLAKTHQTEAIRESLASVVRPLSELRAEVLDTAGALARWPQLEHSEERSFWDMGRLERSMVLPLRSGPQRLGALVLSGRKDGAPLTSDDLAVLETLTSLTSLALRNAMTLAELEQLRQWEAGANREDKRLSVDMLAAEVAHELAYPLNYFRHFLGRLAGGWEPGADEVDIGQEEVRRLERMLASVRKLQRPTPTLRPVDLRAMVDRAVALLRGDLESRGLGVELEIDRVLVRADSDQLLQVFTNLLRNAAQACGPGGRLGVRSRSSASGLEVTVWNTGAPVPATHRGQLFSPWFTTRPDGSGLGLAVTQRIVHSFDWTIDVAQEAERTCFVIRASVLKGAIP